jgi:glycoprotein 3-alpha-L-fucosyltransferase
VLQAVANVRAVVATRVSNGSENVTDEDERGRPWYMSGGTLRPSPAATSPKSGRRMAVLWTEEDPGSDRITNQLMFVPPFPSASDLSGQRLKKILMYYGLGSWFPLKPGRYMFRDARCPVDTCTITLDQKQTTDAEAIVYHHRFAHPRRPRPPRQVRRLQLPYSRFSTECHDRLVSPTLCL